METWLRPNLRVLTTALIALLLLTTALAVATWLWITPWLGAVVAIAGLLAAAPLVYARRPRLGYRNGSLVINLRHREEILTPIDVVECFFLGQAEAKLPPVNGAPPETTSIVVRLAERAEEWKHQDVHPSLGRWCDGYITILGAWCEPIGPDLVGRLNQRLIEIHRERKNAS